MTVFLLIGLIVILVIGAYALGYSPLVIWKAGIAKLEAWWAAYKLRKATKKAGKVG